MKTAIYIRVSTEEQVKEGYSISAQTQKLKAFCISQEWEVTGLYIDEGISAKDMDRPQLQQMIKDIKDEKIECVLVYRLDRLTRSVLDLYKMLEIFEKHDCKFKSATEVYDTTTAMGRMFITIVAALAQWERENMGERISFGYAEKVRQGKYAHNHSPFGFHLNKDTYKLEINPREAEIVKTIYKLYREMGMVTVARHLNNNRIFTRAGNYWSDNTIMKVLTNPIYYGATRWKEMTVEDTHEGIISKEEWVQAQSLMEQRKRTPPRSVSSRYIFAGKLKCPKCGKSLTGHYVQYKKANGERKLYLDYRCRQYKESRCTGIKNVSETKLEKAFLEYLDQYNYDSFLESVTEQGEKRLNSKKEETISIEGLEKQLAKIENRKKKWQYAWTEEVMTFEDFKNRMDEAKREEEQIRAQLEVAAGTETEEEINKQDIMNALQSIKRNWSKLENQEKKNLVQSIVEQIHYKHEGKNLIIESIDFQ